MTETELAALGFNRLVWNNVSPEYWIAIQPTPDDDGFDYRLGVRFNEYKNDPGARSYLHTGRCTIRLRHVTTTLQLLQLYELLSGRQVQS
jgi:hypothetical protein